MRYVIGILCVLALAVMSLGGCGDTNVTVYCDTDGTGGSGGAGGGGGQEFPCTEQGILDAIGEGGGPHTFDCDGAQRVTTEAEIAIDNNVILDGDGNLTVDGDDDHRVFSVAEGATAELRGLVVTKGRSEGDDIGSAISNEGALTLVDSEVVENDGIPLGNGAGRSMTLVRTTVSRNSVGGIFNGDGSLAVIDSTVSDNGGIEAGISVDGDEASVVLTNSTVSGNASGISASGSALTLVNSTVRGDVGNPSADGTLNATGSIIVGACVDMLVTSNGYNIESPGDTCGFDQTGDQSGVSAVLLDLQPLANNGGPTQTHAITTDSAAFNAGTCEVDEDQRGVTRPQGPACDVGAFELEQ